IVEVLIAKAEFAQGEKRILRPFFRQGIHPRDGVTENAIGINERIDARLQRTFPQIASHLHWCGSDGSAIFAVEVPKLEALKKSGPTGIERLGIFLPTLVILFEQIEIHSGRKRRMHHIKIMS